MDILEAFKDIKQLVSTIEFAGKKDKAFVNDELNLVEQSILILKFIINACKLSITNCHHGYPNNYYLYMSGNTSTCQELTEEEYNMLKEFIPDAHE